MIRIEIIFSHFKSIPLGASGEGFRKQTKEGKSLFTLRGLVSCDANETSSELPLSVYRNGIATLFSRTSVCNLLPVCIGLRENSPVTGCCSLSSQLFSSQKLSWEGVLREGSRPFFNRHGATVYMQRNQKCFSHNHERNGRTTSIVNIKRINFVGLHFFWLAYLSREI